MKAIAIVAALTTAAVARADAPTADEINKVYDYYKTGKDQGPVLLELKACLKAGKKPGDDHMTCLEEVTGPVKKGTVVNAWMRWFSPQGGKYEDLSVQFALGGEVKATKDFTLGESWSYGVYKGDTLAKPGEYEIRVRRGEKVLGTLKVTAQ